MILPLALGLLLGALFVVYARSRGRPQESLLFAIGLLVVAVLYVVFALAGGAPLGWVLVEAAGLLPFAGFAWLGVRRTAVWLAVGWALHAGWDLGLHWPTTTTFVPWWYPLLCTSFDLIVAGYLGARWRDQPLGGQDAA